jgi:hypothetical protein
MPAFGVSIVGVLIVQEFEDWLALPRGAMASSFPACNWLDYSPEISSEIGVVVWVPNMSMVAH